MNILERFSTANTSYLMNRKIEYLVIHYTAGTTSKAGTAVDIAGWFARPEAKASADFVVDDSVIVQLNGDIKNRYCWAVGGSRYGNKGGSLYGEAKNNNCISIEICSSNTTRKVTSPNDSNWYFTNAVLKKAKELALYLMKTYNIDINHVIRHYDVNGKPCPGIIGWNLDSGSDKDWQAFKQSLADALTPEGEWQKLEGIWYWKHSDGTLARKGWEKIHNHWYLFNAEGQMLTGIQRWNDEIYYLMESGDLEGACCKTTEYGALVPWDID